MKSPNSLQKGSEKVETAQPQRKNALNAPMLGLEADQNAKAAFAFNSRPTISSNAGTIQTKLKIGAIDDAYEREADQVADTIMRMPLSGMEMQGMRAMPNGGIQRKCESCEEDEMVQRKPLPISQMIQTKSQGKQQSQASSEISSQIQNSRGNGQKMDPSTSDFMQSRFGYDFSNVNIHTGAQASQMSSELNAKAFTVGNDIYFNQGYYQPNSESGKHLLAHELTHTLQQAGGILPKRIQRTYRLSELSPSTGSAPVNPITSTPAQTHFFRGSAANTSNQKALIVGGIHQGERSAGNLSHEVLAELQAGSFRPDFHTLFIVANPIPATPGYNRSAGSGATQVPDLNREFGTGYTSPNPIAGQITQAITEFDPERVLSIHAMSPRATHGGGSSPRGGIFLDPIHARTGIGTGVTLDVNSYPAVGTRTQRRDSYLGDPANESAMVMTEEMIDATIGTGSGRSTRLATITPSNSPTRSFPRSAHPTTPGSPAVSSPYNLTYPAQSSTTVGTTAGTSLGTWASGYGRAVVTIEVPGYESGPSVYRPYIAGIHRFMMLSAASAPATPVTPTSSSSPVIQPKRLDSGAAIEERIQRQPVPESEPTPTPEPETVPQVSIIAPFSQWYWEIVDYVDEVADQIKKSIENISARLAHEASLPTAMPRETAPTTLPATCKTFADQAAIDAEKARWATIIAAMPAADVLNWIVGLDAPPSTVSTDPKAKAAAKKAKKPFVEGEATMQMNCLRMALKASAKKKGSPISTKGLIPVQSEYRSFAAQQNIWNKKFDFTRKSAFDRISNDARKHCGALIGKEKKWNPKNDKHKLCWGTLTPSKSLPMPAGARALSKEEREFEILQASSAPGISRHHYGTEFDILDPNLDPEKWKKGATFSDEYAWMMRNASTYGFLQSFTFESQQAGGYIEERWHWSYYPIAQALLEFARANETALGLLLEKQWAGHVQFDYVKKNWKRFVFKVNEKPVF